MTIRIHTARLIELIGELRHTTHPDPESGSLHGILLHTATGYHIPGEPGSGDILVGTSSMHTAAGHTYAPAFGQMSRPMLLPLDRALHVVTWFKAEAKENPDHTVEIGYDGKIITVKTMGDPKLFGDDGDDAVEFKGLDVDKYPRGIWDALKWDTKPARDAGALLARSDVPAAALEPFVKVAGKRVIELYRYHQQRPILVGIGEKYRGVIMPGRWDNMDKPSVGASPYGEVYDPGLPPITTPQVDPDSELEVAAELVIMNGMASPNMVRSRMRIRPGEAETLLDQLEILGVLSEKKNDVRARDVLVTREQLGEVLVKIRAHQPEQLTVESAPGG